MKAVVFRGIGDIRLETVRDPRLRATTDAIVRMTASAICGTHLHFVRGTLGGMEAGTVLGHEGVGVVEQLGREVRNLTVGDRVVIPSTTKLLGAGRVLAVDCIESRLEMARAQGAEAIDFNADDPVATIRELTGGIGTDRAIDAVGVDVMSAKDGPAARQATRRRVEARREVRKVAPKARPRGRVVS